MTAFTRANAWNHGGTFANTDLLWYAKGVGAMQARALDDKTGWWFYGAMHGEYVARTTFPGWGTLPSPPHVPTSPIPPASVSKEFWNQCQHQTWFFLPWHRGYLMAIEAQVRADVMKLGGPSTWALPYWNYLGPGSDENTIPPAFTTPTLPDGSANPLMVKARYGPDGDGKIFIPTTAKPHTGDPNLVMGAVTQAAMANALFAGSDHSTTPPGFGGPETGFSHGGGTNGNVEGSPHNIVHVYVGGGVTSGPEGLMTDPGMAALDPIFYLHHANIDRLWAAWNKNPANKNPVVPKWLNGPAASGGRKFVMPKPDGTSWVYTPQQVTDLHLLDYTYDNLPAPPSVPPAHLFADRLARLGATAASLKARGAAPVSAGKNVELVGASQAAVPLTGTGARTMVRLDAAVRRKVSASLAAASETSVPDRTYLHLENVRGTYDAAVLSVYINLPDRARPSEHPELLAGSVGLFGLRRASEADGEHAGAGLDYILDITNITDALFVQQVLDVDSLQVSIIPHRPIPPESTITIGRVSIYREGR